MDTDFESYFEGTVDYPSFELVDDILPKNVLLDYVASGFLDGFINYVKIIRVWLLRRYTHPGQRGEEGKFEISIRQDDCANLEKELS